MEGLDRKESLVLLAGINCVTDVESIAACWPGMLMICRADLYNPNQDRTGLEVELRLQVRPDLRLN